MAENIQTQNNTIRINGVNIDKHDYVSLLNQLYDSFFNTYKDMWSKKLLQEILNQKNALIKNILDGNISQIDGSTVKVNNPNGSGIDMSPDGAGAINIGYAGKIADWMVSLAKANRTVNKFDSTSLTKAWNNYVFGGSQTPDKLSWLDRDPVGKDGKRGTKGRIAATIDFLNHFNVDDYTDFDSAFGNADNVRANIENLKAKLSDGKLDNDDYAAALRLGLNLRAILSDDMDLSSTSTPTGSTSDTTTANLPKSDEQLLLEYGNKPVDTKLLLAKVNSWGRHDDYEVSKSNRNFTTWDTDKFLIDRLKYDKLWGGNAQNLANYYLNTFFPKFFTDYFLGKSDDDIKNLLSLGFNGNKVYGMYEGANDNFHGKGFKNYGDFLSGYLSMAIANKAGRANGSQSASLLSQLDSDLLNPISDNSGLFTGYWSIPHTFNDKNGTILAFNPNSGSYKRMYIGNNSSLYNSWLQGLGVLEKELPNNNTKLTTEEKETLTTELKTSYLKNGGILKFLYGGSNVDISDVDWSKYYPTALGNKNNTSNNNTMDSSDNGSSNIQYSDASRSVMAEHGAKKEGYDSASDKQNADTEKEREKAREKYWGLTAKGSDLFNINTAVGKEAWAAMADLGALVAAQFPVIGTAAAAALGTAATSLRAYNRYKDDNHMSLSDIGETAADAGMTLIGLIPGVGAASKAASVINAAKKFAKLGGIGFLTMNGFKSADIIGKIIDGLSITVEDAKVLTNEFSGLMGIGISKAGTKARDQVLRKAKDAGMIEHVDGTSKKYEYNYKDANGNTLKIVTESEEAAKKLRNAIYSKADNRDADIKSALKEFNGGTEVNIGNNVPLRPTGYTSRLHKSFSDVGILEVKPNKAGYVLKEYDPNNSAGIKFDKYERAYWETARLLGKLRPWSAIKNWFNDDSSEAILRDLNTGRATNRATLLSALNAALQSAQNTNLTTSLSTNPLASNSLPVSQPQNTSLSTSLSTQTNSLPANQLAALPIALPAQNPAPANSPALLPLNNVLQAELQSDVDGMLLKVNREALRKLFRATDPRPRSKSLFDYIKSTYGDLGITLRVRGRLGATKDLADMEYKDLSDSAGNAKIILNLLLKDTSNVGDTNYMSHLLNSLRALRYGGTLKFLSGGTTPTIGGITNNGNGTSWYNNIFVPSQLFILDLLKANNNDDTLMNKYNTMLSRHHDLYEGAGGASGNFTQNAYTGNKDAVSLYQTDYSALDKDNFNKLTVGNAWTAGRYGYSGNDKRSGTGDSKEDWKSDGLYSGLTDDRRLFGREGDWDENNLTNFNNLLKGINMELYLDPNSKYYMLRRLGLNPLPNDLSETLSGVSPENGKKDVLKELNNKAKSLLPATLLLASVLRDNRFNKKLLQLQLLSLNPVLDLTFNTFSPIHGDLATRLSYNDAGVKQLNLSNRLAANSSNSYLANASMLLADQNRAENKAKGDLYDNQAIEKSMLQAKQELDLNLLREVAVANKNRLSLNLNERERAQVSLATNSANNLNWKNFFRANVEIPAEYKEKTRLAILDQVDVLSSITGVQILYDTERLNLANSYSELIAKADTPEKQRAVNLRYQADLNSIANREKIDTIRALAQNGNAIYHGVRLFSPSGSYTPPASFRLSQPITEDTTLDLTNTLVTKSSKGSKANWLSLDTMVKEINKGYDRNMKLWLKELDNFWKQFSKMKQAKYGN